MTYLKYKIQNTEPLRIADDSSSQSGQTMSLSYIPGTTIRGYVVNALAKNPDFEAVKKDLLSAKVRFCNAYPAAGLAELFPAPKGFYEDKSISAGKKKIENVLIDGNFPEGYKRAALGTYCDLSGDTLSCYHTKMGSDLKINRGYEEKQNVFRNEYIAPGQIFSGYIAVEQEALRDPIASLFSREMILGNARSAGYGKCKVLECAYVDALPYESYLPGTDQTGECYMLLLSDTVMRAESGEYCGLDLEKLGEKLGVRELKIAQCSTSTIDVRGYNRVWGGKIPSVVMYEKGSVFHFTYQGVLTLAKMKEVCDAGIGIRTNEGFGRVLFFADFDRISYKQAGTVDLSCVDEGKINLSEEDRESLRIAAKGYYRKLVQKAMERYTVENKLRQGNISNSQLGAIEALATQYKYDPDKAYDEIENYLKHAIEKTEKNKSQKKHSDFSDMEGFFSGLREADLETLLRLPKREAVFGIPKQEFFSAEDEKQCKLALLVMMIRYRNKEGGKQDGR
jgi:hypothetical protein